MYPPPHLPPVLASVGPGQSDLLVHFCGRRSGSLFTPDVPEEIRTQTPQQRLDAILRTQAFRAFAPFQANVPAVCLSESPGLHLVHMLAERKVAPWGLLLYRRDVIAASGGAIAYPPESVYKTWPAEVKVWGNPIRNDGFAMKDFSWEREWRIPAPDGRFPFQPQHVAAVLIGNPSWTPTPLDTDWIHAETGEQLPGPIVAEAIEWPYYPPVWSSATHLYWDNTTLHVVP